MSNFESGYEFIEEKSAQDLTFLFISNRPQDIVKAIQYAFVQELNGKNIYNLGFGDYDVANDTIVDNVNTNNGDAYKMFNTVLNTISVFFKYYKMDIIMVQGSDGRPGFVDECRLTCTKKCINECKNYNRRINIYRGYVDKNYEKLIKDYQFFGGIRDESQDTFIESYKCQKNTIPFLYLKKTITLRYESRSYKIKKIS